MQMQAKLALTATS